ncbi:hypothetical protein PDIG_37420 [Penicillium digitatum PHI26]|uniref:Uncharacterized protein n=2 Tax=Penicillium digitatum TaxID=36651 RepID=K9GFK0_PEND2|nr:hypothetical protein PDIP_84010 [Penicillium digitatum Pd1]EKV05227.1 hypothetical protein PDIP_84010 [Penicillium digitatum Pd1]EKV13553.1 hypothetical protein PDIG_37420 [Penicillium digitatum PHI26]
MKEVFVGGLAYCGFGEFIQRPASIKKINVITWQKEARYQDRLHFPTPPFQDSKTKRSECGICSVVGSLRNVRTITLKSR